jgi:hypothetical protein
MNLSYPTNEITGSLCGLLVIPKPTIAFSVFGTGLAVNLVTCARAELAGELFDVKVAFTGQLSVGLQSKDKISVATFVSSKRVSGEIIGPHHHEYSPTTQD